MRAILFFLPACMLALAANGQAPAGTRVLTGHVPGILSKAQPLDRLAAATRIDLSIGLKLRDPAGLTAFLEQLYDPASPGYRHYLTPEEFTARFGPTEQDYQSVIAFAAANGLTVTGTHPNRMLLNVSGTAANVERAFHVQLRNYQHPTENRVFFASALEPAVPAALPIVEVSGLENFRRPMAKFKRRPANVPLNAPASAGSAVASKDGLPRAGSAPDGNSFIGSDFRKAYAPGVTLTGAGQTVSLVQFDGYTLSDILAYEQLAGLPNVPLTNILIDGFSGFPTAGGETEVSLDIEMVISMAPGIGKIFLYEGDPFNFFPNDVLNRIANDNASRQVSCSWGWIGGPNATTDQIFQQMAAQGQTFFNASGDSDAFLPGQVDDPSGFGEPSGSPFITQVGGTTLFTGSGGSWLSEIVWNWGNEYGIDGTGSSGGFSDFYATPSWQQGIDMTANKGSTTGRNIPDVALTGDHVWVIADGIGDWLGGTSAAAPLWAGFMALVNQQAMMNSNPPAGFINPLIYSIGKSPAYSSVFHDTKNGDNTWSLSPTLFPAVPGYDLCTGWGTPVGQPTIDALAGSIARSGLLQFTVDPPADSALLSGSTQAVFITVSDVTPLTNATVNATISGVTNLSFINNGAPPDVSGGDGVYSAYFRVPSTPGPLDVTISATATNEVGITNYIFHYSVIAPPTNDQLTNATKVPAGGAVYLANNRFASLETGEPAHAGVAGARASLWWSWSAGSNTNVLIDTSGSSIDTVLAVYTGTTIATLSPVMATNDVGQSKQAYLRLNANAGTTYSIAVASVSSNALGSIHLTIAPGGQHDATAPSVTVASPLSGSWVSNKVVTLSGTANDPGSNPTGVKRVLISVNNVWQFTADGTNNWTCPVALRKGLNTLRVNSQDVAGNVSSTTIVQLTYVIADPPNDMFANALVLTNTSGTVSVGTTNATREFGEPDHAGNEGGKSVWWKFTAPADGVLTLSTTNSSYDTLLGVYTGATVSTLTTVANNDDAFVSAPGGFSLLSTAVRSNQTYHIAVDGYAGAGGVAVLNYSFAAAPVYQVTTHSGAGGSVQLFTTNSLGGTVLVPGGSGSFAANSVVTLVATPFPYFQFHFWTGAILPSLDPLVLVVTNDWDLTGTFQAAPFTEDFETGNFLKLHWTLAGNVPWFVQSASVGAGSFAARSGAIAGNQSSSLILSTLLTSGVATFDYRISSETNFDALSFFIDGALVGRWSGQAGWTTASFPVIAGAHTLEWRYSKDATIAVGLDAAFIDNINLPLRVPIDSSSAANLQAHQNSGALTIALQGQTNQIYILQSSTNLVNWQSILTNTAVNGVIQFTDPSSSSNSERFYRAIVAP